MARPVSSLESHPQRDRIIDSILAGRTLREIAAQADPPVSQAAICRFKLSVSRKTQAAVAKAKTAIAYRDTGLDADSAQAVSRAALTVAADPILARIMRHQDTLDAEILTSKGDARGVAALIGTDLRGIELHAKLTGRLDAAPAAGSNTFVLVPIAVPIAQALPAAPAVDAEWCEVTPGDSAGHQGE